MSEWRGLWLAESKKNRLCSLTSPRRLSRYRRAVIEPTAASSILLIKDKFSSDSPVPFIGLATPDECFYRAEIIPHENESAYLESLSHLLLLLLLYLLIILSCSLLPLSEMECVMTHRRWSNYCGRVNLPPYSCRCLKLSSSAAWANNTVGGYYVF